MYNYTAVRLYQTALHQTPYDGITRGHRLKSVESVSSARFGVTQADAFPVIRCWNIPALERFVISPRVVARLPCHASTSNEHQMNTSEFEPAVPRLGSHPSQNATTRSHTAFTGFQRQVRGCVHQS